MYDIDDEYMHGAFKLHVSEIYRLKRQRIKRSKKGLLSTTIKWSKFYQEINHGSWVFSKNLNAKRICIISNHIFPKKKQS